MKSIIRAATPFIVTAVVTAATVGAGIALLQDQCWDCPEPLPCPEQADTFYITVTEGAEGSAVSHVGTLDLASGAVTPLSSKATHNLDLNALAFNQTDRLLYAMTHDYRLVRLDKDGEIKQTWDLSTVLPDTDSTPGADGLYRAATSGWAVANQYWTVRSVPDAASPTGYRSTHLVVLKIPIVNSNDPVTLSHVYPIASTVPMMDLQDIAWNKTVHVGNNPPSPNYAFIGYDGVSDQLVGNLGGGGSQFSVEYLPTEGSGVSDGENLGALAFISTGASHQPWLFGEPANAGFGNDQNTVFAADIDDDTSDPNDLHSITSVATHQTDWTNTDGASCIESEAVTSTIDGFACDDILYMTTVATNSSGGERTTLHTVSYQGVVTQVAPLQVPGNVAGADDFHVNAIAMDPSTGILYGFLQRPVQTQAGQQTVADPALFAIGDPTGTNSAFAPTNQVAVPNFQAVQQLANGRYFAATMVPYSGSNPNASNGEWVIAVLRQSITGESTHLTLVKTDGQVLDWQVLQPQGSLNTNSNTSTRLTIADIAFNPDSGRVYGLNSAALGSTRDLVEIDANPTSSSFGFVIPQAPDFSWSSSVSPFATQTAGLSPAADVLVQAGAAFFSSVRPSGNQGASLFLFGERSGQVGQDRLWNVEWPSSAAPTSSTNPALASLMGRDTTRWVGSDGASCWDLSSGGGGTTPTPRGDYYEIAQQPFCVLDEGESVVAVSLHQQPDSTSSVVGTAVSSQTVTSTGNAFQSTTGDLWFEVTAGGTTGWVLAVQLAEGECQTPEDPGDGGEYFEIERTEWCADPGVELRDEPDATASPTISVAGSISNSGLAYTDTNGVVWIEVRVGLESGWVRASQLVEGPCEEATTTTVGGTEAGERQTEVCEGYEGDLEGEQLEAAIAFLHGTGFNVILGTDEDDSLIGTDGADAIFGRGGDDEIDGFAGNDCLFGGPGNDLIRDSGGGDDYVAAGSGDDMVFAGDGLDLVLGEAGSDDLDSGLPSGYFEDGGPGIDTCALFGTGNTINCEQ